MNIVYGLLDLNLVDASGDRCGRVDDVLIDRDGRVVAIVSGGGVKGRLLGRWAHRVSVGLHRMLGMRGAIEPRVIPWGRVRKLGAQAHLSGTAHEMGLDALNRAAAERFVRHIPGATGGGA